MFQVLRRHFARYTPEMVERTCGVPQELFGRVCVLLTENSGPDRTSAFAYSVGWTQHTVGVQYIRTAAILQSLLGNIGRPGGGILALRGHASIQGSTDIPTLFNLLPGYLPMPLAHHHQDLASFLGDDTQVKGFWAEIKAYTVSLLKAYFGDAATADNDFCFDYLPRLTGNHSTYETVLGQLDGTCRGYFLMGENPAVGSADSQVQRLGMAHLDWLVVRDFSLIESATWWKDGPEIESGEFRTEDIGTEVFFLPAAAHTEKDGSFTNTQRLLQWHHTDDLVAAPVGDERRRRGHPEDRLELVLHVVDVDRAVRAGIVGGDHRVAAEHRLDVEAGERVRGAHERAEPGDDHRQVERPGAEAGDGLHAHLGGRAGHRGLPGRALADRVVLGVGVPGVVAAAVHRGARHDQRRLGPAAVLEHEPGAFDVDPHGVREVREVGAVHARCRT